MGTMSIDHALYPHIFDIIVAASCTSALVALRTTSHAVKKQVDKLLFNHLQLAQNPTLPGYMGILLRTAGGDSLPIPLFRPLTGDCQDDVQQHALRSLLQYVQRIDVQLHNTNAHLDLLLDELRRRASIELVRLHSGCTREGLWLLGPVDVVCEVREQIWESNIDGEVRRMTILFESPPPLPKPLEIDFEPEEIVLVWVRMIAPNLVSIPANDSHYSLLPPKKRPGWPRIGTVAIMKGADARELATAAQEAVAEYLPRLVSAVRLDDPPPQRPEIEGVTFMSLGAYMTMRGSKFELEGWV